MKVAASRLPTTGGPRLVPAASLRAASPFEELSAVPGGPPWLVGAWNDRGHVVAVIDVGVLNGSATQPLTAGWVAVIESGRGSIALVMTSPPEETMVEAPVRNSKRARDRGDAWLDLDALCAAMDAALASDDPWDGALDPLKDGERR